MIFNLVVLIFEILYYSMFMYYARREGKFNRYILLFTLITIFFIFAGTNSPISYLLLIFMILYGLRYIIKIKVSLYDMLIIFIMLILNFLIPTPIYYILLFFTNNVFIISIIYQFIKIILVFFSKFLLNIIYKKLYIIWNNNNFYIRYLFTTFMFLFIIFSCIYSLMK